MTTRPSSTTFNRAIVLLRDAVPPDVRVIPQEAGGDAAHVRLVQRNGTTSALQLVSWSALNEMDRTARGPGRRASRVWVVSRATAAQRQQWRADNENFLDLSGAVRVVLPSLAVDRTDLTASRSAPDAVRHTRNPFADRASLVLRVLLEHPLEPWTATALAKAAGVSVATVSLATEALREMGLLARDRRVGRHSPIVLGDPVAAISKWARYDREPNTGVPFAAPVGNPDQFLVRLPKVLGPAGLLRHPSGQSARARPRWALTLQAGASLVAPHAAWDTVHVYVGVDTVEELREIGSQAGWPVSPSGKVVLMLPRYRTSVWYGAFAVRGLPVVSRPQLILDLWNYPVRGREQAEHLVRMAGWMRDTSVEVL